MGSSHENDTFYRSAWRPSRTTPSCLVPIILVLTLTGCVSWRYQPVGLFLGGYSETRLSEGDFIVRFRPPSVPYYYSAAFSEEQHMEVFLLYRCAEVTLLNGHDYFLVIDSTLPLQITGFSRGSPNYQIVPVVSPFGVASSVARGIPQSGNNTPRPSPGLEATIRLFRGVKPVSNPLAYDASELLVSLPKKDGTLLNALQNRTPLQQ